jgi:hypothetical protein
VTTLLEVADEVGVRGSTGNLDTMASDYDGHDLPGGGDVAKHRCCSDYSFIQVIASELKAKLATAVQQMPLFPKLI